MKDKSITVEDYEKYSGEFFDKYFYVAKQLGEGAKAEDILKIMESFGAVVMKNGWKKRVRLDPLVLFVVKLKQQVMVLRLLKNQKMRPQEQ